MAPSVLDTIYKDITNPTPSHSYRRKTPFSPTSPNPPTFSPTSRNAPPFSSQPTQIPNLVGGGDLSSATAAAGAAASSSTRGFNPSAAPFIPGGSGLGKTQSVAVPGGVSGPAQTSNTGSMLFNPDAAPFTPGVGALRNVVPGSAVPANMEHQVTY